MKLSMVVLAVLAGVACDGSRPPRVPAAAPRPSAATVAAPAAAAPRATLGEVGLDPTALDRTADPCDDFYQYACGGWLAANAIPDDRTRWSRSVELGERNQRALLSMLESESARSSSDPAVRAVATFYGTCMDESAREVAGTRGIEPLLRKIRSVHDRPSLVAAVAELHRHGVAAIFVIASEQDAHDATRVIARLDQGGLGLPDRDYYINDDARSQAIRARYLDHVGRMMRLAGTSDDAAMRAAAEVMALETQLARVSKTRVERRDPSGTYHKVDRAGLARLAPAWGWDAYFHGLGFTDLRDINVTAPGFLRGVDRLLASTQPAAWRAYLEWSVLNATADALPARFEDEAFAMWRFMSGQQRLSDRWRRCITATDEALGEALGQLFVARYFADGSRDAVREMVTAISDAFGARLAELAWMDDATKARARHKRDQISYLIGYPSTWRVYNFSLDDRVHAANVLAGRAFEVARQLTKAGKPLNPSERCEVW